MVNLKDYAPFTGLLIFGNIENLILASQGAVARVDPFILGGLSLIAVVCWLLLGAYGTKAAISMTFMSCRNFFTRRLKPTT